VTIPYAADATTSVGWVTGQGLDGFVALSSDEPYVQLRSNPETFSVTQRVGQYGPVVVAEIRTDTEMEIHCGSLRST
jgi:hypothetical protein